MVMVKLKPGCLQYNRGIQLRKFLLHNCKVHTRRQPLRESEGIVVPVLDLHSRRPVVHCKIDAECLMPRECG